MKSETRVCQNCKREFVIEPEDFAFYDRIKVPAPTWCPECRNIRRMAWREDRTLYKNTCALCGKTTVSIYKSEGTFTVYCRNCWESDRWDPLAYGRDYDFSKPFFQQYRELMEVVPRPALTGNNLVQSEYTHASFSLKNCYFVSWGGYSEDCLYCYAPLFTRNACDCYVADNSDHVYEVLHSNRMYKSSYAYFSENCMESSFLYDCVGCSDCFGCINIRKQKYQIFNKQYSKEEYRKQMEYWDLGSYERLQEAQSKFRELYLATPRRFAHITNSINSTGDILRDCKDCKVCFSALDGIQNCKYLYLAGLNLKDSYDCTGVGDLSDLLYESMTTTGSHQMMCVAGSSDSTNLQYCDFVYASSNVFGSFCMKHKKYCILNKQYSKEEYQVLLPKIIAHMNAMPYVDRKGRIYRYGDFFPSELSAFGYNETLALTWYPKTREEVMEQGWNWQDPIHHDYEITKTAADLPDNIRDTADSIVNEVIECDHRGVCKGQQCSGAFRITKAELDFHRMMRMALPRLCPNCRHYERFGWRNKYHLYRRSCDCKMQNHHHLTSPCDNSFETTFKPDCPETIYCQDCYNKEFY